MKSGGIEQANGAVDQPPSLAPSRAGPGPQDVDEDLLKIVLQRRSVFVRYLRSRLNDRDEAEDVFQDFCVRVLRKGWQIKSRAASMAWLRTVLRSTLIDHVRRSAAQRSAHQSMLREWGLTAEQYEPSSEERELDQTEVCECLSALLPTLKTEYSDVLTRVDLLNQGAAETAAQLGISSENVRVRLHRARRALKSQLEKACGGCRDDGCFGPEGGEVNKNAAMHVAGTCSAASA